MNRPSTRDSSHGASGSTGRGAPQRPIADHWQRFRRLMLFMAIISIGTVGIAIWRLRAEGVPFHLHFMIAMGGGIVIALLLAGALMGLAFVSNRSGHDEAVSDIED